MKPSRLGWILCSCQTCTKGRMVWIWVLSKAEGSFNLRVPGSRHLRVEDREKQWGWIFLCLLSPDDRASPLSLSPPLPVLCSPLPHLTWPGCGQLFLCDLPGTNFSTPSLHCYIQALSMAFLRDLPCPSPPPRRSTSLGGQPQSAVLVSSVPSSQAIVPTKLPFLSSSP